MEIQSIKIAYFSPTGTTKSIVDVIAQGMNNIPATTVDITTPDGCFQSSVCSKICPVGAIDLQNSAIIDKEKCILCSACVKTCSVNVRKVINDFIKGVAFQLSQAHQVRKEPMCFLWDGSFAS